MRQPLDEAKFRRLWNDPSVTIAGLLKQMGWTSKAHPYRIAKKLGLSNVRKRGPDKGWKDKVLTKEPPEEPVPGKSIDETIREDVVIQSLRSEVSHYRSLYHEAVKRIGMQESVVQAIQDVARFVPAITVHSEIPHPKLNIGHGSETDVLQLSDLHAGERVDPEETMGMNIYDMTIMNRRLGMLFRKVVELVELRRSALYIPRLRIEQEGDMLSGEIHEELVRTNVAHMMNLCVRTASILSQGIAYVAPHFDHIDIDCVVGNHPRLYKKPYFKEKYINWDFMMYQWEAVFCRNIPNVTFHIPKSPFMIVEIENTRGLVFHGDGIRSWMGIPWYGIERAVHRLREMFQYADQYFDCVLLGHFHNRADIDRATGPIIINGSVKGGDQMSMGSLQTTNRASQNLLCFHDNNGYIGGMPIYLQEADDKPEMEFKDFMPEVWVDMTEEVIQPFMEVPA
ncbi:hypothetical protein ACFLXE_00330 [Chloroflexota bacterium]